MTRLALILMLLFATGARAQPVAPADHSAIQTVIEAQLEAFRRDDGPAAFAYASPMIQAMFETPPNASWTWSAAPTARSTAPA